MELGGLCVLLRIALLWAEAQSTTGPSDNSVQVEPSQTAPLGCWYDPQDLTIRCRNASLDDAIQSFRILASYLNGNGINRTQQRPKYIDIGFCVLPHLPYLLPPLNATLKKVQIVRSQLEYIYPDAFAGMESTLEFLDLSHNKLHSVPYALSNLRMLRELHLQDNQIVFLRPSPVFENLAALGILNLANNFLGLSKNHIVDSAASATGSAHARTELDPMQRLPMDLEDFNLEPVIAHLEVLDLSGNKMASFPKQLYYRPLSSMKFVNFSVNQLEIVPTLSAALPQLEKLDLHSNRIQELPFYAFPPILIQVDLSGNPLRCDCGAAWIPEWAQTNNASVVYPSTCHSAPPSLSNASLPDLSLDALCPFGNGSAAFRYVTNAFGQHEIVEVNSNATAIQVKWHADRSNHTWHVVYRKATDHPNKLTLSKSYTTANVSTSSKHGKTSAKSRGKQDVTHESVNRFVTEITNLLPSTNYIVCVAVVVGDRYLMKPEKCRQDRTKDALLPLELYGPLVFGSQLAYPSNVIATDSVASAQIHVTSPRPKHDEVKTVLTNMETRQRSLTVTWKLVTSGKPLRRPPRSSAEVVEEPHLPHEWVIRIRRFATFNVTQTRITDPVEEDPDNPRNRTYQYTIGSLVPGSGYDICLEAMDTAVDDQQLNHTPNSRVFIAGGNRSIGSPHMVCKEIETLDEASFPVAEVAIATTVSTSTTILVIILACFWCPRPRTCCQRKKSDQSKVLTDDEVCPAQEHESSHVTRLFRKCKTKIKSHIRPEDSVMNSSSRTTAKANPLTMPPFSPQALDNQESIRSQLDVTNIQAANDSESPQDTIGRGTLSTSPEEISSTCIPSSGYFSSGQLSSFTSCDVDGYLTPIPPDRQQSPKEELPNDHATITFPSESTKELRIPSGRKKSKTLRPGERYINPEDIQYISGKNVQIFVRGSRTLPRKAHLALMAQDQNQTFHPRYSLPHAFKRKRLPVNKCMTVSSKRTEVDGISATSPSELPRTPSNGFWFHPKTSANEEALPPVYRVNTGSIRSILKATPRPELTTVVEPWMDVRPRPTVDRQFYIEHV